MKDLKSAITALGTLLAFAFLMGWIQFPSPTSRETPRKGPIEIRVQLPSGDTGAYFDISTGSIPAAFGEVGAEARFICSKTWRGVLADLGGQLFAINDDAIGAIARDLTVIENGVAKRPSRFAGGEDAQAIITRTAFASCHPHENIISPPMVPDGPAKTANPDRGRALYSLVEVATEYCPNIEAKWGTYSYIATDLGYPPPTTDAELARLQTEKKKLFASFRAAGRQAACELVMNEIGPGGAVELLQFK